MKITATRLDDLRKAREEYDLETNKLKEQADANLKRWEADTHDKQEELEKIISNMIGPTSLELSIRVDPWGRSFAKNNTWIITVNANDNKKFDENVALAWSWEAAINNDGDVVKDSSSWSGLKAVTPEQIADLEESVRIIKLLNNMDWATILSSPKPDYDTYVDRDLNDRFLDRKSQRPDFEKDINDAIMEDLVGTNVAIQLTDDSYYNGRVGILLTGMTDKFLKGYIFPWNYIERGKSLEEIKQAAYEPRKTSKSKIVYNNGEPVTFELV